jgi:hypothetical protein
MPRSRADARPAAGPVPFPARAELPAAREGPLGLTFRIIRVPIKNVRILEAVELELGQPVTVVEGAE